MSKVEDALLRIGVNPERLAAVINNPKPASDLVKFLEESCPEVLLKGSIQFPESVTRIITPEQFCERTLCRREEYPALVPEDLFRNIAGMSGTYTAVPVPKTGIELNLTKIKNKRISNTDMLTLAYMSKIKEKKFPEDMLWIVFRNNPLIVKGVFTFCDGDEETVKFVRLKRFSKFEQRIEEIGFVVPTLLMLLVFLELIDIEQMRKIPKGTYITSTFFSNHRIFCGSGQGQQEVFLEKDLVATVLIAEDMYGVEILPVHESPEEFLLLPIVNW